MTMITVNASRYGGEQTIGTITEEQAHFWYAMGNDLFVQYLHYQWVGADPKDDLNNKWNIPKHLQLPEFYEIADIEHINAPEFADRNWLEFEVESDSISKEGETVTIAELEMSDPSTKSMVLIEPEEPFNFDQMYESDKVVVYGKTHAKGVWTTAFEIDGEFDINKLELICTEWADLLFVTGFVYEDKHIDHDGWQEDSLGKDEYAWIVLDTLKGDHDKWCNANPELMKLIASIKMKEDTTLVA